MFEMCRNWSTVFFWELIRGEIVDGTVTLSGSLAFFFYTVLQTLTVFLFQFDIFGPIVSLNK